MNCAAFGEQTYVLGPIYRSLSGGLYDDDITLKTPKRKYKAA
jgi:hypothetical protein